MHAQRDHAAHTPVAVVKFYSTSIVLLIESVPVPHTCLPPQVAIGSRDCQIILLTAISDFHRLAPPAQTMISLRMPSVVNVIVRVYSIHAEDARAQS